MANMQGECRLRHPSAGGVPTPATSTSSLMDSGWKRAAIRLALAALLCVVLIVVTFVGGLLTRSLALLALSIHVFGDLGTLLLNLIALYIGTIRPNSWLTFGWIRAGSFQTDLQTLLYQYFAYLVFLCNLILRRAVARLSAVKRQRGGNRKYFLNFKKNLRKIRNFLINFKIFKTNLGKFKKKF